jgi:hypothetical protein
MITGRGCVVGASTHVAPAAPLESRNTSRDPATIYAPAFNSRAHSFSDSSSCLLLFVSFFATVKVSYFAIAVAAAFRKSLVAVTIYETYSIDLHKPTNRSFLGARVTLAATL